METEGSKRGSGFAPQSSNGDAEKQQQKPTSSLPEVTEPPPKMHTKFSISCGQRLCKAVRDAGGFGEMKGNVTTLALSGTGKEQPRQAGSPIQDDRLAEVGDHL